MGASSSAVNHPARFELISSKTNNLNEETRDLHLRCAPIVSQLDSRHWLRPCNIGVQFQGAEDAAALAQLGAIVKALGAAGAPKP
jgi:hypothetical protein